MGDENYRSTLICAARELARARRVLVITGAGLSADSGLPTYRGISGLYESGDTEDDVPIEDALSGAMMRARPSVCWKYIAQIERGCRGARPNTGHDVLARWQSRFALTVLTQNVDGLHVAAGQRDLIEIHSNIHELYCLDCASERRVQDYGGLNLPPVCTHCGGLMRPRVVLFGEALPQDAIGRLEQALADDVDAVLSIGTTSVFPYIAAPVLQAARNGKLTIEINPGDTEVSNAVQYRLKERAAVALLDLEQLLVSPA